MATTPRLTVVVTAHQRSRFLRAAVESVLHQTVPRDRYEILVTKDFWDPELDRFLEESGVRVVQYREPGIGAMYARAAAAAQGDLLAFLDDDDLFEPRKLEVVERRFRHDPELKYLNHWYVPIDAHGNLLDPASHRGRERAQRLKLGSLRLPGASALSLLRPLPELAADFCGSLTVVTRNLLLDRAEYCASRDMSSPDTFLYFSALLSGGSLQIDPETLTRYRLHDQNHSRPTTLEEQLRWHRRLEASYGLILRMAQETGAREEVVREAEALVLLHRIDRALQDPDVTRTEIRALFREGRRLIGTHRWNGRTHAFGHRGLLLLLSLYTISPRLIGATRNRWRSGA